MIGWNLLLIGVLILLNGFFVGVEFAAVASRRSRLDILIGEESRTGNLVREWLDNQASRDRLIAATQLGITVVSLALGAVGENTFAEIIDPLFKKVTFPDAWTFLNAVVVALPLIISLTLVTSMHVVFGEQVPKVAVLRAPEKYALTVAPFMQVFITVFKGFVNLLDWLTRQILELLGLPPSTTHTSVYSLEEFKQMVSGPEMEGVIQTPEREMLSAVIDFGALIVRQVCIPRTEIIAVEASAPLNEMIALTTEHTLTKLPVYENNLDQILGIVHVRDMLLALQDPTMQHSTARDLVREGLYVPGTISVNDLLVQFRARRQHIAIVLDEYGGTAGLVTLEDLMEEIVGEFQDPFDAEPPAIQTMADGTSIIDGLTLIDEVNEYFGLNLLDANYDTIAGFVLGRLGRIPMVGDTVEVMDQHVRLKVESMDNLRISRLSLHSLQ